MAELVKISRTKVMKNAHYLYSKCRPWYRAMYQLYTFSDFLAYAWRVEKERVAEEIRIQEECKVMEQEIAAIKFRRALRNLNTISL